MRRAGAGRRFAAAHPLSREGRHTRVRRCAAACGPGVGAGERGRGVRGRAGESGGSEVRVEGRRVCQIDDSVWISRRPARHPPRKSMHYRAFGAPNRSAPAPRPHPSMHYRVFGAGKRLSPALGRVPGGFGASRPRLAGPLAVEVTQHPHPKQPHATSADSQNAAAHPLTREGRHTRMRGCAAAHRALAWGMCGLKVERAARGGQITLA